MADSNPPSVSVALPVFNGEKFLRESLESLLAQTFSDYELIISDNASTDGTEEMCRTYAAQDHRIRYFRHEYEAHINDKYCPAKVCRRLLTFFIREDLCVGCGSCKKACPTGAADGKPKSPHHIDTSACIKCGACYDVCKFKAVLKE